MTFFVVPGGVMVATPLVDISSPSFFDLEGEVDRALLLLDVPDATDFRLRDDERALFCSDDNVSIPLSNSDLVGADGGITSKLAGVMSEFTDDSLYR